MTDEAIAGELESAAGHLPDSPRDALPHIRRALALRPGNRAAQRMLTDVVRAMGTPDWEQKARELVVAAELDHPELARASGLIQQGQLDEAEALLQSLLDNNPDDVRALRLQAVIASKRSKRADAERLLLKAVELAPDFDSARYELAVTQYENNKLAEAIAHLDRLIGDGPRTVEYMKLKAAALSRLGRFSEAARVYRLALAQEPGDHRSWIMYGHALRVEGRLAEAIAAYREAIAIDPGLGRAWWSLANIKTARLDDRDIAALRTALDRPDVSDEDRTSLHFALGKALEDKGEPGAAFETYASGNAIVARANPYAPEELDAFLDRSKAAMTGALLAGPRPEATDGAAPIFVVGMPRAGSTLVEQILASHSQIEASFELPHMIRIAKFLDKGPERFPATVPGMSEEQLSALGKLYLENSAPDRPLGRPYFVDKNPNNWTTVGLIRLILPNARIIDVRRHPLDCGFSNFRQLFANGHEFSYSLESIGHYYAHYVELMAHWDAVAPGAVHRVIYERLVEQPETEIRALLDHVGVEFEPACLAFHETRRSIRTPSSEQVQRPINREGVDRWKIFDPWLVPLRDSLGPVLEAYPGVPSDFPR